MQPMSSYALIPPGKPDAYEPHKRVSYHGQKGETCTLYALMLLRGERTPLKSERTAIEKSISTYRKQIIKLSQDFEESRSFIRLFPSPQPKIFKSVIERRKDPETDLISQFKNQKEITHFGQYVERRWAEECIKIHLTFYCQFNPEAKNVTGDPLRINYALHYLVLGTISQEIYKCQDSSWDPGKGIDDLIQQLAKGPMLVNAKMGKFFYEAGPKKLNETLEGRNVYGWPQNSPRRDNNICHTILLVGAKKDPKNGIGYVYFIDPADPSEPEKPETQKVYRASHERLFKELYNVVGYPYAEREQIDAPFAWQM